MILFVDCVSQGLQDFDVATVRELRGVDPGLLANVEVMPFLDSVDGLLEFLGDLGDEAGLWDAGVAVRGEWGVAAVPAM